MLSSALAVNSYATDVILNASDASNINGDPTIGTNVKTQPLTSLTIDGYSFTFADNGASNKPAYWTDQTIRIYQKSSVTITAPTSTKFSKIIVTDSSDESKIIYSGNPTSNCTYTNTGTVIKAKSFTVTLVSAELGDIMYGDEAANGQNVTATAGDVFTFTADNAESMSIKMGTEETPSITSDTNSISWTAETPIADNTTYNLTISATKGSDIKTATFTVVVKKAPLCTMPPVFTPGVGTITKGSTVTITCENAKQIKYWISENADDTEADAQTVDAPATVTINQNCWLHACGINADGIAGETSAVQYTVTEPTTAMFDFNNVDDIKASYSDSDLEPGTGTKDEDTNNLHNKPLTKNGITVVFAKGSVQNAPRWWAGTPNHVRLYKSSANNNGNTLTITSESGKKITRITFTKGDKFNITVNSGQIDENLVWTPSTANQSMAREASGVTSVTFTGGSDRTDIQKIAVEYAPSTPTGIADIEAEDGEAVYFNLQGVRVQNPEKGIFIRVQNGKASKIMK